MTDYEPTDEDLTFLNRVDQGYVGITRPKVDHHQVPNPFASRFEDTDNDPSNPEENWEERENLDDQH